jgi:type II secretory pathway pseudopilin PulG
MRKKFQIRDGANSFTLLEMLGVLAVMAILASVAVPPMLRSLQNAQSVNEDKNLEEIGRALCEAIQAEGQVPNPGAIATNNAISGNKGWVGLVAPYCSMASNSIRYVYPDRTETERRFYILTMDGVTPFLNSPTSYSVPTDGWQDTVGSWPKIRTSFLVLISSSKPDYLLACPANGAATYSAWATGLAGPEAVKWAAREWVKQAVNGVYSATNTQIVDASWTNKGQFLHVKVIPMNSLICNLKVVLGTYGPVIGDGLYIGFPASAAFPVINIPPAANTIYTTRGSTVTVRAGVSGGAVATATTTAPAASSSLNLNFIYDTAGSSWFVTP